MKSVPLPSGAELKVPVAPFEEALALYQAVLEEFKPLQYTEEAHVANLYKDLFCTSFSSKKILAALAPCMKRCLYNGEKVVSSTWEPTDARQDYMPACIAVASENISPFLKSLYAEFSPLLGSLIADLASRPTTTPQA